MMTYKDKWQTDHELVLFSSIRLWQQNLTKIKFNQIFSKFQRCLSCTKPQHIHTCSAAEKSSCAIQQNQPHKTGGWPNKKVIKVTDEKYIIEEAKLRILHVNF